jgi:serine/threonine-protein kinase
MKKLSLVLVISSVSWLAGAAEAQVRPEAEKLFRDGKSLMKAGKIAEACGAFEASEKAEHNVATVLSLADCREKNQQYASAWALFLQADSQTRTDASKAALNSTAKARATALEPRLSYLTINVPDESRITDLVVSRDGIVIDRAEWNRAIPIDGGAHEITGKAPGHESWSTKVTVAPERDKQSVEVPKFKELPKLVAPPPGAQGAQAPMMLPPQPSVVTPRRKVAIGVAAGGLVLAGAGVGFGINASSLRNEALATCPTQSCSVQGAADANAINERARKRAVIANVGFAAGGAAVIAGAVLWFVSGPRAAEAPPAEDTAARRRRPSRELAVSSIVLGPQVGETSGLVVWGRF